MAPELITDMSGLTAYIDNLPALGTSDESSKPEIYIEFWGSDSKGEGPLTRDGVLSLIMITLASSGKTCMIDCRELGEAALFNTPGNSEKGQSLRSILEDGKIQKGMFNVLRSSDALHSNFQISLKGAFDIQLMELASRKAWPLNTEKLDTCILKYCEDVKSGFDEWAYISRFCQSQLSVKAGGGYNIFDERPLPSRMLDYCINRIEYMPKLFDMYLGQIVDLQYAEIIGKTAERIRWSQSPDYEGLARWAHSDEGPLSWHFWAQRGVPQDREVVDQIKQSMTVTK